MEKNFSDEEIAEFLKLIGADANLGRRSSRNLYRILGVSPETDDEGNRVVTPYEVLAVPPQFRDGKEVPIVFAIKNRVKKIGHFTGADGLFYYAKKNKFKDSPSIESTLSELKRRYKRAAFLGNMDEASTYLDMINELSGGRADEVMGSYFNYALFYKKMKKQLLMDMFSHFFLTYLFKYRTYIKEGLFNTNTHFKPYIEKQTFTLDTSAIKDFSSEAGLNVPKADFGDIKSFKFETPELDSGYDLFETKPKVAPKPNVPKQPEGAPKAPPATTNVPEAASTPKAEVNQETQPQQSFIKQRRSVRPSLLERLGLSEEALSEEPVKVSRINTYEMEDTKSLD